MTIAKWERELALAVWEASTSEHVEQIIKAADSRYGIKRVPVGRRNNHGTIRMASDPGLALVERLTNGIDSLIELAVMLRPGSDPRSPEEAAHLLYGVPVGGLAEMSEGDRRKLATNLVLSMHESGITKRPTVRVQDAGIGQHPDDFNKTLLSLNEENKVGKAYTMGTYGQGGSVTLGFSDSTVIVSRRHPQLLDGKHDEIGWTVAFEEESDPAQNVLSSYVWIVKEDGSPLRFPRGALPELDHGTRITHVGYDVQSLTGPFTTQMWQFLHSALFDPVLPLIVTGDRKTDPKKKGGGVEDRVIIGNAARLANVGKARGDLTLGAFDTHEIDLGEKYGSVEMSWWALIRPAGSTSKTDAAAAYVQANSAVSLTLHGQRQDAERRAWIKDRALLPHLYKNMVVQINANKLLPRGRREIFAATREKATESELKRIIYDTLADLLRTDPELKRLNHEEKEKLLRQSTAATNDKIRRRLGKFIKTKLQGLTKPGGAKPGSGKGASGTGQAAKGQTHGKNQNGGGGGGGGRLIDDAHLHKAPTEIKFESNSLRVAQGFSGYVWVLVNAKNGYLPEHDGDLSIAFSTTANDKLRIKSKSRLLGGKARWSIEAEATAPGGEHEMSVELMTSNGLLTASIPVIVVPPPDPKTQPISGVDDDTGPDVRWVSGEVREEMGMTPKSVGRVDEDDESTIIWVNRDFSLLSSALSSSTLSADQVETRADRYQYPVACGLWLQHHEQKSADPKPDDSWLAGEMHRLAEAVLVAMDPDVDLAGVEGED